MSAAMRPLVAFTDQTDLDPAPGRALLEAAGFDTVLLDLAAGGPVPAAASRAVALVVGYANIDAARIAEFPELRIVTTTSAGFDMVDVGAAEERGIWVVNLVDAATEEVAAHALALTLAVERQLLPAIALVEAGGWTDDFAAVPRRLSELTLGLFGFGRIAQRLAAIAAPSFGRVIAHDPYATEFPAWVTPVSREELFAGADVLSLHLPLTAETRGAVGAAELAALPEGATLINVSRGELVDGAALVAALDSGRIAGAGLDVLEGEPPAAEHPLRARPGVLVTPHIGFLSVGSLQHYLLDPCRSIIGWARTGRPERAVVTGADTGPLPGFAGEAGPLG